MSLSAAANKLYAQKHAESGTHGVQEFSEALTAQLLAAGFKTAKSWNQNRFREFKLVYLNTYRDLKDPTFQNASLLMTEFPHREKKSKNKTLRHYIDGLY